LAVNELSRFTSFDIAVAGYAAGDTVLSADTIALTPSSSTVDPEFKVYSFGLNKGAVLYLLSADKALTGKVKNTAEGTGQCLIWGTDTNGNAIKLEVTSEDNHRLAVSSDLKEFASVTPIVFNKTVDYTDDLDEDIVVTSDDASFTMTGVTVRQVGRFFTVENNTVKLNLNLPVENSPYEGKIFVDFSNGATAVAKVTAKVSTPYVPPSGGGGSGGGDEPEPEPDPDPTPGDAVVDLPVADAVVVGDTATVTVDIPVAEINSSIEKAIEKAEKAGEGTVPTVSIPVTVDLSAGADAAEIKEAKVDISLATLEAIVTKAESEKKEVALQISAIDSDSKLNLGEITLDTEAIRAVIAGAGENAAPVELVITKSTEKLDVEEKLDTEQKKVLEDKAFNPDDVFDISLSVGNDTSITSFGGGKLTIALPYTPVSGAKPADFWAYNLPVGGGKDKMYYEGNTNRSEEGKTIFRTDHLSVYAVAYEPEATPQPQPEPEPEPEGGGSGGGCSTGFGAAWGLLFVTAYLARLAARKR
jgi:hypothetical protein